MKYTLILLFTICSFAFSAEKTTEKLDHEKLNAIQIKMIQKAAKAATEEVAHSSNKKVESPES